MRGVMKPVTNPITKEEIINLFRREIGIRQLFNDYYIVNTEEVLFNYHHERQSIRNVSIIHFKDNHIYFNNKHKYNLEGIGNNFFLFSTQPSKRTHWMVRTDKHIRRIKKELGRWTNRR